MTQSMLTRERVYDPLRSALDQLEQLTIGSTDAQAVAILAEARNALARIESELPPAQDMLEDWLGGFGPLEGLFSRAQTDAWREGRHSEEIAGYIRTDMYKQLQKMFSALAATPEKAAAAVATLQAQEPLLIEAITAAQKDGWGNGDYCTEAREDVVDRYLAIVRETAHGLVANKVT